MKNVIITFLISLISLNSFSQESTEKIFDLNSVIELFDMNKEETHIWLTNDEFFTHIADKEEQDGKVYGFDYNSELNTSTLWLHKYYKMNEMYLVGKNDEIENIIIQLKPYLVMSNLKEKGTSISSHSYLNRDFIVRVNSNKPTLIKIIETPVDQTSETKIVRHKNMTEQN